MIRMSKVIGSEQNIQRVWIVCPNVLEISRFGDNFTEDFCNNTLEETLLSTMQLSWVIISDEKCSKVQNLIQEVVINN